jgi:hypothetical protein
MYLASGYHDVEEVAGSLEDGTPFPLFRMRKRLDGPCYNPSM